MATVEKDFKVKKGLIVEGTTGTINNYDILTKKPSDQTYIIGLIGGAATSNADPDTVVLRDANADFSANMITANLTGNVTGTVSDISNHTTDALSEGTINKYYSDSLVDSHLSGGDGISYSSGTISADLGTGLNISAGQIAVDRTTVDVWYDAAGAASSAVSDHANDTATHGVGEIVGTTESQTLTNKTIGDELMFNDGSNTSSIDVTGNDLSITAYGNLTLATNTGDIVLNPDGGAYIGSASAGNTIATNSYVDNAVSGLTWKQSVNVLATVNVPLSGSTPLSVDSHTLSNGYRVLLTAQSTNSENGIYDLLITGGSYTLSRAADADVFGELIGAAVFVMEGTTYNNTSWVQSNHYLTDFTSQSWTQFSGSGSVTAGTGIIVDGLEVSVDTSLIAERTWVENLTSDEFSEGSSNLYYTDARVDAYVNTSMDTDDLSEGSTNLYYTNARVDAYINASIDTDDVSEGTSNLYYTDNRAKDAAGYILENSIQSNIVISYDETTHQLTVTAEDGFAGHTTSDLTEGTNLYFTNARAVSALEAVVPNFTEIDINALATQVAATTGNIVTASLNNVAYAFAKADYRSAKFLVKCTYGTHTEIAEVLLTLDTSDNIAITEYAIVGTNGSSMTISAGINGTNVELLITTLNNNSTVTVVGTLLA